MERRREGRATERRETERRETARSEARREGERRRSSERYRDGDRYRSSDRYRNDGRHRNDGRYESHHRNRDRYRNREPYYAHGRISRCERYGNGYRVWVGGAAYPFFVPLSHWHRDRFRVGLTIRIGGYYNPLGYYDYWDGYRDGYRDRDRRRYSDADFAGVVERVDYRRDTFFVRDEYTGDVITVVLRDRRESLPRRGDFVAVRGDWTSFGYFRAYDVEFLD